MTPVCLSTLGRRFYPGFELPLVCIPGLESLPVSESEPRLGVCLLESGTLVLRDNDGEKSVNAPALLVFDNQARPAWVAHGRLCGASLYFHPQVINSAFAGNVLPRGGDTDLPLTSGQDTYLFEPFHTCAGRVRVVPLSPANGERLANCFRQISQLLDEQPHDVWPCLSRSFLIEALFLLRLVQQEAHSSTVAGETRDPRLIRALQLLHERFHEPLSLDEVARQCATNRTTLNSLLRQRTGVPMRAYLVQLRLSMAENLLRDTELPVSQIASRVGYENLSHFIRIFRSRRGQTPAAYRQTQH